MKVFEETQRASQTWLIVLLVLSSIIPLVLVTNALINNTITVTEYIITIILVIGVTGLIFTFKLHTKIDDTGIYYRFSPFHLKPKHLYWTNIEKAYIRQYDGISEYGGWGLKGGVFWKKSKGKAITISGDKGLQLELKTGKKILIGTQQPHKISAILRQYTSHLKTKTYG